MSVATINTKATGVVLTEEEKLTFADIVEAGFTPAPNTSVDLSGYDPIPKSQVTGLPPTPFAVSHGGYVPVWDTHDSYNAWCTQTEEMYREQRAMIVAKYLEMDYQPLDPLFKAQFVHALRGQSDRQCRGTRRTADGRACAMGIADEVSHGDLRYVRFSSFSSDAIIALNDIAEWTFAQIADWVEAKL